MVEQYDLVVVGAGSGGFATAITAAKLGQRVALIEKSNVLGGNAVRGGVNNWEPGVGATGVPFDLYRRLRTIPNAVGITSLRRHVLYQQAGQTPFPGGEWIVDPQRNYLDSLHRHGTRGMACDEQLVRERWHAVVFEPDACDQAMHAMLNETGHCTIKTGLAFTQVHLHGPNVTAITLSDGSTIHADVFVDATADIKLVQAAGHPVMLGQDGRNAFDEPDAPPKPTDQLNAATLIYRITPRDESAVDVPPEDVPAKCWWDQRFPAASFTQYPCGDFNVNMLPTMSGNEAYSLGHQAAYAECRRRVFTHWRDLQSHYPEFRNYGLSWIAPALGVREGPRLVGRYILTEHDLLAGLSQQRSEDIIAIADHAMDIHGSASEGSRCPELAEPYGVPLRCLMPRELDNVLVACRGASFSAIANSSCRLSRTMMQLGQAAGTTAAVAQKMQCSVANVDPVTVRESLLRQHVQLEYPMPKPLQEWLQTEQTDRHSDQACKP